MPHKRWESFLSVAESVRISIASASENIPREMQAAVYLGKGRVAVQAVATPKIGRAEILVRVESCGVCHTDLKKIEYDLLTPPRIYGHETAGVVAAVGANVTKYVVGDRVVAFHHIPCGECFYCERRFYAQCPTYKKVGITAGFEPAGGGFAQYVRVMDWIVERGVEKIPDGVSFDQACWVEPVNTCLKGVELLAPRSDDVVAVLGQGPIGLIFTMLLRHRGISVIASDTIEFRRNLSSQLGAFAADPRDPLFENTLKTSTKGRGADIVILATSAKGLVEQAVRISRPGAKILLFAQTSSTERIEISAADVCVGERMLLGSYSADIDLQAQSARLVFSGELPLEQLVSDRVPLSEIERGISIAQKPGARSLKVVVHPQERIECQ
jgi:L-iditol 2-dehydrogenase